MVILAAHTTIEEEEMLSVYIPQRTRLTTNKCIRGSRHKSMTCFDVTSTCRLVMNKVPNSKRDFKLEATLTTTTTWTLKTYGLLDFIIIHAWDICTQTRQRKRLKSTSTEPIEVGFSVLRLDSLINGEHHERDFDDFMSSEIEELLTSREASMEGLFEQNSYVRRQPIFVFKERFTHVHQVGSTG